MLPYEVLVKPTDKERLVELLTEADTILDKYPPTLNASANPPL